MDNLTQYIKYRNVFHTEAFRIAPVSTLWRSATWLAFHVLPRWPAVIKVNLGNTSFRLRLLPILRYHGSTGIYVLRSKWEPLLEYCDCLVQKGAVVMDCAPIRAFMLALLVRSSVRVDGSTRLSHSLMRLTHCNGTPSSTVLPTFL